ncbi:MAG: NAD(+) kinase [Gammaproteobacteria bacterium]|nr:MAG: NAD(+) kinase [Gammaproteobacteria bacterium]
MTFDRIGIICKQSGDVRIGATLARLIRFLESRDREILFDTSTIEHLDQTPATPLDRQTLAERADLVIVVGGDGTLLNAVRSLVDAGVPVVGVNLGRLGFLADVSPESMEEHLDRILSGQHYVDTRSLLHASVVRGEQTISDSLALNDVVIHKWDIARMIEYEVSIDGRLLDTQRSDGLIVFTPTGSTAYALSAGGPLVKPGIDILGLVPICPHSLNNRPIVVDGQAVVDVHLRDGHYTQAQITCDGQVNFSLLPGDHIRIRVHAHRARLIHPPDYDYFAILRNKFGWGTHT